MSEENPWQTKSSKIVYRNDWIRVREDQVVRPDGSPGIYGVVEAKVACGVIALTEKNEVYLVGQYRYATRCYSWEIVEGGAEHGEDPLDATKRELREEAGLTAKRWEKLGGDIHLSNCFSSEVAMLFLARDLSETERSPDPTEVLKVKTMPLAECLNMVRDGKIVDAMSIIALFRLDQALREGRIS